MLAVWWWEQRGQNQQLKKQTVQEEQLFFGCMSVHFGALMGGMGMVDMPIPDRFEIA